MPSASATAWPSSIIALATARLPGSAVMTSSVAVVSALIGLKAMLPHSFTHNSSRMRGRTGAFRPAAINRADSVLARSERVPSGSPRLNRSP